MLGIVRHSKLSIDKSWIVACHRLGKTGRAIVKFLNRKDAENFFPNKRKLKDVDISCLLSDGIQDRNVMTTRGQKRWENGRSVQKKENVYITESLPVRQVFVWFSQREEGRGSYF